MKYNAHRGFISYCNDETRSFQEHITSKKLTSSIENNIGSVNASITLKFSRIIWQILKTAFSRRSNCFSEYTKMISKLIKKQLTKYDMRN